ncbi:Fur family transcriptional regulator [Bacillus wiedmannii]|uniref:Fur family transcriptional regulator n=1 Tax=Bacillus wiedmannii TaxID=1890302 RepID=A0A2A7BNG3_9BACI|nr:Fur family transcriptional regulator [Bacillus wiedmannii]PDY38447.1 Fur family transcriptional regulator [Bacillus wiedmannii]
MTVIIGGNFGDYVQISADRRRSTFIGDNFSESTEEWANKIIQLSSHIVLAALGDVDATKEGKKRLVQVFQDNPSITLKELVIVSESIFRDELKNRKIKYAEDLHKKKSFICRVFSKKKPLEEIRVNAAYLIGGFDLDKNEPFLYLFGNDKNYEVEEFKTSKFIPLGECMDEIRNRLEERLYIGTPFGMCMREFETEIKFAASKKQSVNENVYHCTITKKGITFRETPPKPAK